MAIHRSYDFVDVLAIFFSCFSVLTVPLYLSLVILLFKEREKSFKGSFFRYFSCLGLLDMTSALNNFFGVSLPGWGITITVVHQFTSPYAKIYLFLAWFTRLNQGMSTCLIAVNRAYALMFPMAFATKSTQVTWMHLLQIVPGIAFGAYAAYLKDGYLYWDQRTLRRATPRIEEEGPKNMLYAVAAGIEVIMVLVVVVCYVISSVKLLKKKECAGKKKQTNSSAERSATLMGVFISTMELVYFAYMVMTQTVNIPSYEYFSIHSCVTDLYSCINCYLILLFSPSVRRKMWHFISCSKECQVTDLQKRRSTISSHFDLPAKA